MTDNTELPLPQDATWTRADDIRVALDWLDHQVAKLRKGSEFRSEATD